MTEQEPMQPTPPNHPAPLDLSEASIRQKIVLEAHTWVGTPYKRRAMLKGVGADCATFLFCVYRTLELVPDEKIGMFGDDWFHHTESEHYMERLIRHAPKVVEAVGYLTSTHQPGNILLMKAGGGRRWNHGAIVLDWPRCIHAIRPHVAEFDITTDPMWSYQVISVFDPLAGRKENDAGK